LHTSTEIPSKTALRRCEKHQCQWSGEWRNICSLQNQLTISGKLILTSSRNNNSNKGLNAAPYGYAKLENHETGRDIKNRAWRGPVTQVHNYKQIQIRIRLRMRIRIPARRRSNTKQTPLIIAKMFLIKCKCQISDYKKNTFH